MRFVLLLFSMPAIAYDGSVVARRIAAAPQSDSVALHQIVTGDYTNLDSLDGGPLDVRNQFLRLGDARVTPLLPERSFCSGGYFALLEGTYCYHASYGEPFQIRRLDAFSVPRARDADQLTKSVLGDAYGRIRELLFFHKLVVGERLQCATFSVEQFLRSPEQIGLEDFSNFYDPPHGVVVEGLACRVDGEPVAILDSVTLGFFPPGYEIWDLFTLTGESYLVVLRTGYEYVAMQLYAVEPPRLRLVDEFEIFP